MPQKFTLYWSNLERYENCPQEFLWCRGWGAIDVGGGPGRPKPKPLRQSRHHAVMGIVIQSVIEDLYNNELWRNPRGLPDRLVERVEAEWARQTAKERNWIDYRIAGTKESLLTTCREGVLGYLRTMKQHRLLGPYARCEVELLGWIDKWNPIGGRADFIMRREADAARLPGITILDGKNSKSKGRYTDPDQLRWYALLFYLAYRQLPDRVGFVYYRYPYGAPVLDKDGNPTGETEEGVDWVDFTKDDLKGLAARAVAARKGMNKEKFAPTPKPAHCKWCDYESVCETRQAQIAKNRRKRKKDTGIPTGTGGFTDLSL